MTPAAGSRCLVEVAAMPSFFSPFRWRLIAQMLTDSATAVRDAVKGRVLAGRDMDLNYDHPVLMLQLLLWHEGYHHGQIKLALKLAGRPISNDEAGPFTWDVWRGRK